MTSRLFALDGAEVVEVDEEPGGSRTVWVVTADRMRGLPGLWDHVQLRTATYGCRTCG